jgi:hypothetical protein
MYLLQRRAAPLRYVRLLLLGAVLAFCSLMPVAAETNSAIAQQFNTKDGSTTPASLVALNEQDPSTIELAQTGKERRLVGVVSDTSAIELSAGGGGVQVVTSGATMALVSDLNGTIKAGDKVTASPIKGVGMKATENGTIVGTAQSDFTTAQTEERTITDKTGADKTVKIGLMPVQVGVVYYSVNNGQNSAYVPAFLQSIADNIAGRNVSAMRVIAAGVVMLLVVASVAALLYGAVRSSIISIGRNPLSESAVRKGLFQVTLTALGVLLFAGISIYLILAL